jgi:hypothetical protein
MALAAFVAFVIKYRALLMAMALRTPIHPSLEGKCTGSSGFWHAHLLA